MLEARASADARRDVTWTLDATITFEAWERLTPYRDWLSVWCFVDYPDGTRRQGQLGLYLVMDAPERRDELTGAVQLVARDPLYLLSIQGFQRQLLVRAGTDKARAAKEVLDSAVLTEGRDGRPRYAIPRADNPFKRDREWPKHTSKLQVANEMLEAAGYYPLWSDAGGVLRSRHRAAARLRERTPVALFAANAPPGATAPGIPLAPNARAGDHGLPNNVVGTVETIPKGTDMENEIILVNDDPNPREGTGANGRVRVKHRMDNPRNRRRGFIDVLQAAEGRTRARRPRYVRLDDDASAAAVAAALADELTTYNTTLRFAALPDPQPDYLRETVAVAIWDAQGRSVAYGQAAIFSVNFGLTADSALMTIEAGLVGNADPLLLGVA